MDYDVIVVGARCAGAATALLLARGGARVLVLERGRPGSDTLSTHGLARPAVLQLHRWGVLERIIEAGTPCVTSSVFHYADEEVAVPIRPADGIAGLYNPRRSLLDAALVDAAAAAGAEVRHGHTVTGLLRDDDGRVRGVRVRSGADPDTPVTAGLTIGADGRGSRVARAVAAPTTWRGRGAGVVEYRYLPAGGDQANHFYYRPGGSAGSFPTNDGLDCVFVAAPPERLVPGPGAAGSFHGLLAGLAPDLADRAAGAPSAAGRSFAGLAGWLRRPWGPGWALVGDAGYFKDPITAHGITDALRDADLLAEAVLAGGTADDLRRYERQRDDLSLRFAQVTDEVARYRWDLDRVRELHLVAAAETRREVALLRARAGATAPAR